MSFTKDTPRVVRTIRVPAATANLERLIGNVHLRPVPEDCKNFSCRTLVADSPEDPDHCLLGQRHPEFPDLVVVEISCVREQLFSSDDLVFKLIYGPPITVELSTTFYPEVYAVLRGYREPVERWLEQTAKSYAFDRPSRVGYYGEYHLILKARAK